MLRNNFLALAIHIVICFITFQLFSLVDSLAVNNKIIYGGLTYNLGAISVFLFAIIIYLLTGRLFRKQETKAKDILSVAGVSLIGLCIWIVCFIVTGGIRIGGDLNWALYVFYEAYFFPILTTFNIESPILAIIFAVIPSIVFWLSMQIWDKRDNSLYK